MRLEGRRRKLVGYDITAGGQGFTQDFVRHPKGFGLYSQVGAIGAF